MILHTHDTHCAYMIIFYGVHGIIYYVLSVDGHTLFFLHTLLLHGQVLLQCLCEDDCIIVVSTE